MKSNLLCGALVAGFVLVGCSNATSPVGTWKGIQMIQGEAVEGVMEYTEDGKVSSTATVQGVEVTMSGEWSMEGDQITILFDKYVVGTLPPEMEMMRESMEEKLNKGEPEPVVSTVTFEGQNKMVFEKDGELSHVNRVR